MIAPTSTEILLPDAFLSEHLARDVRRVDVHTLAEMIAAHPNALRDAMEDLAAPALVYARIRCDAGATLQAYLQAHGFVLIDTAVTLERGRMNADDVRLESHALREAKPADEEAVARLATTALMRSRFHCDERLTLTEAARVKSAWVRSAFAGSRGDVMIVAADKHNGGVDGFLLALRAGDGAMVIDLVAVDGRARRRGICRALTLAAQQHFPEAHTLRVGTQGSNTDSLEAYRRMGFVITCTDAVMHAHTLVYTVETQTSAGGGERRSA